MAAWYCESGRLALPGPLAGLTMTVKVMSEREKKLWVSCQWGLHVECMRGMYASYAGFHVELSAG